MLIPRSARRSSTLRSDSGYLTYIITTRRMTSGELLKYRNGSLMTQAYPGQRRRKHLVYRARLNLRDTAGAPSRSIACI